MSSLIPAGLLYSPDHEWLDVSGETGTVGITAFAAQALGDIVFVQLPGEGETVSAGAPCGEVESTKSVSELYAPAAGTVVAVNEAVVTDPSLISTDPYCHGWLYRLRLTGTPPLLSAVEYQQFLSGGTR